MDYWKKKLKGIFVFGFLFKIKYFHFALLSHRWNPKLNCVMLETTVMQFWLNYEFTLSNM